MKSQEVHADVARCLCATATAGVTARSRDGLAEFVPCFYLPTLACARMNFCEPTHLGRCSFPPIRSSRVHSGMRYAHMRERPERTAR
jgi:hypothetical protein